MMQPNVTIVLPVYNVEPYLRQCLDSVVNQTMREIQVICVNDGSTDGSPAILEEYAAKDPRIMIIHQENQGGGSARNAAFPHIKGKYTYFVDPDDWIDLQLCEKLFKYAEEKQAEIVFVDVLHVNQFGEKMTPGERNFGESELKYLSHNKNLALDERKKTCFRLESTWRKFWNSLFLLENQITFVSGKRPCNDVLQNWKGMVFAEKIEVFGEKLYYHRKNRPGSYQTDKRKDNNSKLIVFQVYDEIKEFLIHSGYYDRYKEYFLTRKLPSVFVTYARCPSNLRRTVFETAMQNFGEDERVFCQESRYYRHGIGRIPGIMFGRKVFAKKEKRCVYYAFISLLVWFFACLLFFAFAIGARKIYLSLMTYIKKRNEGR